jgi:hypothetical protein
MTSYLVRYDQTSGITRIVIKAGLYEIRMAQINFWGYAGVNLYSAFLYDPGATVSGASAIPVVELRQNAPVASATAQQGSSVTLTGTARYIGGTVLPPGSVTSPGSPPITTFPGSTAQMTFPLPTIVAPGGLFVLTGASYVPTIGAEIYFEELRLAGSY